MNSCKKIGFARTREELKTLRTQGVQEVLLEHELLARLGTLTTSELETLAIAARELDLRPILHWDLLMTEPAFEKAVTTLNGFSSRFWEVLHGGAIRVQDPGALHHCLHSELLAGFPIHLNLESGNHNRIGIEAWIDAAGVRLERVILSIEIPRSRLQSITETLLSRGIEVELLGDGPILLLYTPRPLLSTRANGSRWQIRRVSTLETDSHEVERKLATYAAIASSEEDVHQGFRVVENSNGTFLFHAKDYSLLEKEAELAQMGVRALRIDHRLRGMFGSAKKTHCFYAANATDVLFKFLKNTKVQRQDPDYLGEVVESQKDSHTIVRVMGRSTVLDTQAKLEWVPPSGKQEIRWTTGLSSEFFPVILDQNTSAQPTQGTPPLKIESGDFLTFPYIKGAPHKTAVYLR